MTRPSGIRALEHLRSRLFGHRSLATRDLAFHAARNRTPAGRNDPGRAQDAQGDGNTGEPGGACPGRGHSSQPRRSRRGRLLDMAGITAVLALLNPKDTCRMKPWRGWRKMSSRPSPSPVPADVLTARIAAAGMTIRANTKTRRPFPAQSHGDDRSGYCPGNAPHPERRGLDSAKGHLRGLSPPVRMQTGPRQATSPLAGKTGDASMWQRETRAQLPCTVHAISGVAESRNDVSLFVQPLVH